MGYQKLGFWLFISLLGLAFSAAMGCTFGSGPHLTLAAPVEEGEVEEGEPDTPSGNQPSSPVRFPAAMGFSSSGGIARTSTHVLISDPSGILSDGANLNSSVYQGAIGFNPSEVLAAR